MKDLRAKYRFNTRMTTLEPAHLLQGQGVCPSHTIVLTETTPAKLEKGLKQIANLAAKAKGDVLFFFYYSGHGDSHSLHLGTERFNLSELNERLNTVPAKLRVAVIDACRSKDDTQAKGFKTAEPFETRIQAPKGLEGAVTVRSSADGEASQESDQLGGAVFTHFFMTALRGRTAIRTYGFRSVKYTAMPTTRPFAARLQALAM